MKDLIAKLEAASKGSRQLDLEIAVALGWEVDQHDVNGVALWLSPNSKYTQRLPEFSTSIDAALTLVPEGWYWGVGCRGIAHLDPAGTFPVVMDGSPCFAELQASTPALALCIAALIARDES